MSKEAMNLRTAAEKVVELCSERPLSLGKWFIDMSEACESLRKALAEPDFWAGYVPEPDGTCSNTLREQGKAYPRTCKKCGLGPCVELAQQALDKKAENARELGLDYEPAQPTVPQDIPDLIAGALGVSRGTAYDMMREALAQQPAQQEPVATCPQDIIHAITLYGDARADQDANNAPTTSHERLADCIRLVRKALAEQPAPTVENNSQDWKGMDGTTAWHLIDRHANGWADIGKMMGEWLLANQSLAEQPDVQQEPVAWMTKTGSVWKTKADETDTPLYTKDQL